MNCQDCGNKMEQIRSVSIDRDIDENGQFRGAFGSFVDSNFCDRHSKKKLKALQRRAYLSFHLRPAILFKMLLDIKSWNHLKLTLRRIWDYLFRR